MHSHDGARKRSMPDIANENGNLSSYKRSKETVSAQPGLGTKLKSCTKFFSTSGCPFGEGCHFLHYVPGGYSGLAHMMTKLDDEALPRVSRTSISSRLLTPAAKTRLCAKYNSDEGCKFGVKCRFAHGESELRRVITPTEGSYHGPVASFGTSASAKVSVDASLAGAIIGKAGMNSKQICRLTGVKLFVQEHDTNPNLKNIELEGTFDQIKQATAMVRELIVNISAAVTPFPANRPAGAFGSSLKTKLCDNYSKGVCSFGERCHFAHGPSELRRMAA